MSSYTWTGSSFTAQQPYKEQVRNRDRIGMTPTDMFLVKIQLVLFFLCINFGRAWWKFKRHSCFERNLYVILLIYVVIKLHQIISYKNNQCILV